MCAGEWVSTQMIKPDPQPHGVINCAPPLGSAAIRRIPVCNDCQVGLMVWPWCVGCHPFRRNVDDFEFIRAAG